MGEMWWLEVVASTAYHDCLYPLPASNAMPQSFFLGIPYLLAQNDVLAALGTEDVPAETAVVSPSDDRQKFFTAIEAVGDLVVLFPLFFGL